MIIVSTADVTTARHLLMTVQDMYTPIPIPASLKEYKSFEFLQRDLRVTGASPSGGSLHGGQVPRPRMASACSHAG